MAERLRHPATPPVLLATLCAFSLLARAAALGEPCRTPCRTAAAHLLVFDEDYYVNAARVIAGVRPPPDATYASAPLGDDPNSEHPQLAKLIMAGSIELLGDGPLAWRLGSLLFGTLAIAGMYALARSAGACRWLALAAAALMAFDNLMIVHGRIATLDVYVLAAMVWSVALYLRRRALLAGIVVGVAASFKLVGLWVLPVLALVEAGILCAGQPQRRQPLRHLVLAPLCRLGACAAMAAGVLVGLIAALDAVAPPYDAGAGRLIGGGPFGHIAHMVSFGSQQVSPHGASGIASYPWEWLIDLRPIVYLNINPAQPGPGLLGVHPAVHFLGAISPPIMLLALPALALMTRQLLRHRREMHATGQAPNCDRASVPVLALAWFAGTFVPFLALSLIWKRTSYLYYMVVVMPGIYLALADLLLRHRSRQKLLVAWVAAVVAAALLMYPFTPLP